MQGFNKYYPPDYDPEKHSSLNAYRGKHALGDRARKIEQGILITRFELPFNIWCNGCNNHIGMGVRYNAEKKKVGNYYSTPIYSFRCKCHLCDNWFTIETDPKNTRYVVTSGARQKDEEWNPEENGGFAIHDPDKVGPEDPLAALEKTTEAQNLLKNVQIPRLEQLYSLSEHYNADPFAHSARVRKRFREEKKLDLRRREADEAMKGKYALPEELTLIADDESIRAEAKEEFSNARRELQASEDAKRRRFNGDRLSQGLLLSSSGSSSSIGPLRSSSFSKMNRASVGARSEGREIASSVLRNQLLRNSARHSTSNIQHNRLKPPDARTLGVSVRK